MDANPTYYKGCLLGMAVGDAMGSGVDAKAYSQICESYGPAGLLGYDLANGFAQITSHTQVAAFACNGLLLSIARGQMGAAQCLRNITLALKEWARVQHLPRDPSRRSCWLSHMPAFRARLCMDARTLDALTRDVLGTPKSPGNQGAGPGTLTAAIPVGLFFHPERMQAHSIGQMGAQVVALTHGNPMTFLSGAVLAYTIAGILQAPECALEAQIYQACEAVEAQFGETFPQAKQLTQKLTGAADLAAKPELDHVQAMESLKCDTGAECLAGAVYAALASGGDFDTAMIIAVNHSGKSAAVGAVTGALLGAMVGEEALPEFYLECLEVRDTIGELASDLCQANPSGWRTRLFDDEWDRKYTQGIPKDRDGWAQA